MKESSILKFRSLLETHGLACKPLEAVDAHLGNLGLPLRQGTLAHASIVHAPSSTKHGWQVRSGAGHDHTGQHDRRDAGRAPAAWQGKSMIGDAGYNDANKREGLAQR